MNCKPCECRNFVLLPELERHADVRVMMNLCYRIFIYLFIFNQGENGELVALGSKYTMVTWNLGVCLLVQNVDISSVIQDLVTNLCIPA